MDSNQKPIRTRFAPSPTGFMHVGNLRTALFAWLTARHDQNGAFILRIEDTDQKREVPGAMEHLMAVLEALDLDYDEGPAKEGPYAPYIQSKRLDIYKKWANKLVEMGRAYADPYTADEISQFREDAKNTKQPFLYRNHRPDNPPAWDGSLPLRFKSDPKDYTWQDEVMGELSAGEEAVDDFVLMKSDGYPTYNFAHIVDDAEMQITHVIRGQEFISSTPNYLNLYEALGLDRPILASMPHILAESGGRKLGKRDGAKDVMEYLKEGYLKEALINFIASMGWNDGSEQEIFSVEELKQKFSLSRVGQSGARFDNKRLVWMNGKWMRRLNIDELMKRTEGFWPSSADGSDYETKKQVLILVQDRLKTLADLEMLTSYFFEDPTPNWDMVKTNSQFQNLTNDEISQLLDATISELSLCDFSLSSLTESLNSLLAKLNQKPAILFSLIRLCVSWAPFSPALDQTLFSLGKDRVISRLKVAKDYLH